MIGNLISIPLDDSLRRSMEDILNKKEISLSAADNMIRQLAFIIMQQKDVLGVYDTTEYLMSIPGMRDIMIDPFYHTENYNEIKRRIAEYESGITKDKQIIMTMEEFEAEIYG